MEGLVAEKNESKYAYNELAKEKQKIEIVLEEAHEESSKK